MFGPANRSGIQATNEPSKLRTRNDQGMISGCELVLLVGWDSHMDCDHDKNKNNNNNDDSFH